MSGQIDEVSAAIGSLQSSVDDIKRSQDIKANVDADFRRDVRAQLGAVGLIAQTQAQQAANFNSLSECLEKQTSRVDALEKRVNRFAGVGAGMLIVLSILWYLVRDSFKVHIGP